MKSNKRIAVLLAASMLAGSTAISVSAASASETETYVLMNIPYSEFYQADVKNEVAVDAYTSATKSKPRTGTLAGGSYHVDSSGDAIEGITFPVKLVGEVDLSSFKKVNDSDTFEITVKIRGKDITTVYSGKETLFENPDYSYYVLDSKPDYYKEVFQNSDGSLSFGETKGTAEEVEADVELTRDSRYGDYQMNIYSEALSGSEDHPVTVYGVVISTEEGCDYGLRHMENIWRNTSLAWCTGYTKNVHGCETSSAHYEAMVGQTINKVTYYTSDGIKTISDLSLYVDPEKYALMNIPYSDFYEYELVNDVPVDVYSSATLNKPRTGSLAAGSYHAKQDGSEITGITYPVKLGDIDLTKNHRITDSDSYEVTVTNRGKTTTTVYEGKDALFGSESYSFYILNEMPSFYKTVNEDSEGNLTFGKDNTPEQFIEAEAELTTDSRYGDYQLNITSDALTSTDEKPVTVYGVILETVEGGSYGLRHMENIWRNTSLAWCTGFTDEVHGCKTSSAHYEKMMGQTICKITYFTNEGKMTFLPLLYVPVKTGASVTAETAEAAAGQTTYSTDGFADDYAFRFTVTNDADEEVPMTIANGTITYPTDTTNGKYTLTVSDENGKYASVKASFELTVNAPAVFNGNIISDAPALIAAEGTNPEELADFLENISEVTVDNNTYSAVGKGAVKLIDSETGFIDVLNTDVFAEDINDFTITVKSVGYNPLTFTLSRTASDAEESSEESSKESSQESSDESSQENSEDSSSETSDSDTSKVSDSETSDNETSPSEASSVKEPDINAPKTAEYAVSGIMIAMMLVSAAAVMIFRKKKENEA